LHPTQKHLRGANRALAKDPQNNSPKRTWDGALRRKRTLAVFRIIPRSKPKSGPRQIGRRLSGVPRELFAATAREMPLMQGAIETVVGLRKAGFRVDIVTGFFQIVAETVRRRVFADFCFGNRMRFKRGKASGRITLCPAMFHEDGCSTHAFCKSNILLHLGEKLHLGPEQILAVGDGENDICNLRAAGLSVAFQPKSAAVAEAANYVLNDSLAEILSLIHALPARDAISMA
jgi:glucosyl-3-phosphoglycerate synthase